MIKQVIMSNWKSFANSTLYIDPISILIGANAGGKSNTVDALSFLYRVGSGVGVFQAINGDLSLPSLRGGVEWVCRKPYREFALGVVVDGLTDQQDYRWDVSIAVNGTKAEIISESLFVLNYGHRSQDPITSNLYRTTLADPASPVIPTDFSTDTQGDGNRYDMNRSHVILAQTETMNVRGEVQEGAKRVLSQLQSIFILDPIPSHMRGYTPFSDRLQPDGSNLAGVLAGLDDDRRAEVEQQLTTYASKLPERDIQRVWTEPVGKFKTDAMLYCEEGWGTSPENVVDARGMSDGTLRFLAIVTALLTCKPNSLLVIEEVDNGLHPSRAHILVQMLSDLGQQRKIDVVITTHNPAILDAAGAQMIPFITVAHRDESTGASRLTLLEDIQQLPKLMAGGSIGRLQTEGSIETALKQEAVL